MTDQNNTDSSSKNVISESKIAAGNNVHIGDNINVHQYFPEEIRTARRRFFDTRFGRRVVIVATLILFFVVYQVVFPIKVEPTREHRPVMEDGKPNRNKLNQGSNPGLKSMPSSMENKNPEKEHQQPALIASEPLETEKPTAELIRGDIVNISAQGNLISFRMNKYEVTVGQYFKFCQATGRAFPHGKVDTAKIRHPITHVSWIDAMEYCQFVGGRLPSMEEWRYAATLATGRDSSINDEQKVAISWNKENSIGHTRPVGTRGVVNSVELFDIFGNVEEWCSDGPRPGLKYTMGGSFKSRLSNISVSHINPPLRETFGSDVVGFRVVF